MLTQARSFLLDNNYAGALHSPKVIRQLDMLFEAYLKGLAASLAAPPPLSGGLLAEVRIYVEQAKRQQAAALHAAVGLAALPVTTPFKAH